MLQVHDKKNFRTSKFSGIGNGGDSFFYTKGKEFTTEEGEEYFGEYYLLKDGSAFAGPSESDDGKGTKRRIRLYPYYANHDSFVYDSIFRFNPKVKQYSRPVPHLYVARSEEGVYTSGFDVRFFVQRYNVNSYAIEIKQSQFDGIGQENGIDSALYAYTSIVWRLTGTLSAIREENRRTITIASAQIPGLIYAIPSLTQFALETQQTTFSNVDSLYIRPKYKNNGVIPKKTYDPITGRIIP